MPEILGYQHVQGEGREKKKEPKGKLIVIITLFRQIEAKQEAFQENTKEGRFLQQREIKMKICFCLLKKKKPNGEIVVYD